MIAIAIYADNFVCFWYFAVKQRNFYSFEPGCVRPGLVTGGLRIFYRNQIRMSFAYKECGLVALTFFQNQFYKDNKHAFVKSNIY